MCYSTQVYHFKRLPLFNSPMRSQEAKGVTLSLWLILIIQILHHLYNIKQASVKALSSLIFSSYLYIILNLNVKIFSWLRAKTLEDSTKFIQNFLNFVSNIGEVLKITWVHFHIVLGKSLRFLGCWTTSKWRCIIMTDLFT